MATLRIAKLAWLAGVLLLGGACVNPPPETMPPETMPPPETVPPETMPPQQTDYTSQSLYEEIVALLTQHSEPTLVVTVENDSFGQTVIVNAVQGTTPAELTQQKGLGQNAILVFESCVEHLSKTFEFRPSKTDGWDPNTQRWHNTFKPLPAGEQCWVVWTRDFILQDDSFRDYAVWGAVWSDDEWPTATNSGMDGELDTGKIVRATTEAIYTVVGSSLDVVSQRDAKLGSIKVALIFAKEQGVAPSFDKDAVVDLVNSDANDLLKTVSYGKRSFEKVDTFGWLEYSADEWCAITSAQVDLVTTNEFRQLVDVANYHLVTVIADALGERGGECHWGGNGMAFPEPAAITAATGEVYARSTLTLYGNRDYYLRKQRFFPQEEYNLPDSEAYSNPNGDDLVEFVGVFVHEFLHTQGLGHAFAKNCSDTVLSGPDGAWWECTLDYYNKFDLMSSARFFGLSLAVPFREQLGWLTATNRLDIEQSGTYRLNTLNSLNGFVAGRIKSVGEQAFPLWMEYRTPGRFDYALNYAPFEGIVNGLLIYQGTSLLDATPPGAVDDGFGLRPVYGDGPNVALNDSITIEEYGVIITLDEANPAQGWIEFTVEFTN